MTKINTKQFPAPIAFSKMLGPSFIILALGLGSGEVILWPYLSANYGLGIAWAALLGVTFQYFINMEIERYALVKGESVFVGIAKIFKAAPYWFIVSTFVGFGLPGIIAASATVFSAIFGIQQIKWLAIGMLIFIGLILSISKTVYGIMEKLTISIIAICIPFVLGLAVFVSSQTDLIALFQGLAGDGNGYWFMPAGISLATFLAAFAYSGAGGNLNLTQSIYIKEKGYGMGAYSQKISGLFKHGRSGENIKLEGEHFLPTSSNFKNFELWWKKINAEHLLIFWFIGLVGILLLMTLSYATAFGNSQNKEGILFVITEANNIGLELFPLAGTLFLFAVGIMLFQTQLGILDSTSRIMAENIAINRLAKNKHHRIHLSKIYFSFVWTQIAFGVFLFLVNIYEPRLLIVAGAVINAIAMFVHIALVNWTNMKLLPAKVQPTLWRKIILLIIFIFFGFFSIITVADLLF